MDNLRLAEILVNNVSHVCVNHAVSMLKENISNTSCPCYLFRNPHHVTADSEFRRIADAFTRWSTGDSTTTPPTTNDDDEKSTMLREIGILPPSFKDAGRRRLASLRATDRFCSRLVRVIDYVSGIDAQLTFDRRVVVYIDPTPTDVGRSLHAMCFVVRAERTTPGVGEPRFYYVLLAVEEFATDDIDIGGDRDRMHVLARVFMTTIEVLTQLYEGYFQTFVVAPEANTIHVNGFWEECAAIYSPLLETKAVSIFSTTVCTVAAAAGKRTRAQRKSFRIGYVLGGAKVGRIYDFFSSVYNPAGGKVNAVACADYIWSWTISRKGDDCSIPLHVANRLERLEIRPTVNRVTGRTSYKIGGKGLDGHDDLAIATVMSVCLCQDMAAGVYGGDLVRLTTTTTTLCAYERDAEDL